RVVGNLRKGVSIESECVKEGAISVTGGVCCFDGDTGCYIYDNEADCVADGGTYQGDGTTCDPVNPCYDCSPGNGLPLDSPSGSTWVPLTIHLTINNTAKPDIDNSGPGGCGTPTMIPLTFV